MISSISSACRAIQIDELKEQGYVVWTGVQPKGAYLAEGDTYCFLNLIGNGLRGHEEPHLWGMVRWKNRPSRFGEESSAHGTDEV